MHTQNRQHLRHLLRMQRRFLTPTEQHIHAQMVLENIINGSLFNQASHIAFYLATDGELSAEPLIHQAVAKKKACYLPVLHPTQLHQLLFMPYQPGDALQLNRFNFLEPPFIAEKTIFPWNLCLAIVPLIAFDSKGCRLGFGKGYYDRSFAFRKNPKITQPRLLGLAHELQYIPFLQAQAWDIPVDAVATEKKLRLFPHRH